MKTLIKTGYYKILKLFYENKKARIHLRDIARKTKLNENSVTRFLKALEKEQILISKKDGNLKKYNILKNSNTLLLFAIFDMEKLNNLPVIRKRAINYFLNSLKEKPIITLLFGSTATETFKKNSDIDLLLIMNKKGNVDESEKYVDAQTGIKVNCLQVSFNEFIREIRLKQDKVMQSALNNGYPIFNNIYFYEVYLNEN